MGDTRKEEKREVGKEGRKSYKDPFYCLYLLCVCLCVCTPSGCTPVSEGQRTICRKKSALSFYHVGPRD